LAFAEKILRAYLDSLYPELFITISGEDNSGKTWVMLINGLKSFETSTIWQRQIKQDDIVVGLN